MDLISIFNQGDICIGCVIDDSEEYGRGGANVHVGDLG